MIPESLVEAGCPRLIKLKVGAQVMLTKNLNLRKKLCNGSRGVVKRFTESGSIICPTGSAIVVTPSYHAGLFLHDRW